MWVYRTFAYYGRKFNSYHIPTYAASASFFIITAVFPLLMLILSVISFTPWSPEDFIDMVTMMLPESFAPMVEQIAGELMTSSATVLSVSAVAVLWTAARSMLGLLDGLNAIADVNDTRNFILKRMLCIGYMLVLIVGVLVNLGLRVFGQHILNLLEEYLPHVARAFDSLLQQKGLTLFGVFTLVFMLIYTAFPNRKMKFLMQLPGAAFTSFAWMAFSVLFSIYVNQFGQFSTLYGGLTTMILVMLWLYFCMYIVFIGAVINKVYPEIFWKGYVLSKRWKTGRRLLRQERRERRQLRRQERAARRDARKHRNLPEEEIPETGVPAEEEEIPEAVLEEEAESSLEQEEVQESSETCPEEPEDGGAPMTGSEEPEGGVETPIECPEEPKEVQETPDA